MREIKFRGKRVDNGEWVEGLVYESHKEHHSPSTSIITGNYNPNYYGSNEMFKVIPETVGQFTGLLDKNGVEIYEGDVIKYCGHWYGDSWINLGHEIIVFDNGCFNIDKERIFNEEIEVIGNIHDNSGLLKQ